MRSNQTMRTAALAALFLASQLLGFAQNRRPAPPQAPAPAKTDTVKPAAPAGANAMGASRGAANGPKAYKDVITAKAKTTKGLFTVHKVEDKYYFEIDEKLFGREIMAVTRYTKVAGGGGVYGGELANQQVVKFEKGPDNKIFMRVVTIISVADSSQPIYKAVSNSNLDPIAASFPVAALGKDSTGAVIDVTDFLKGDNQAVSLNASSKRRLNLSMLQSDRSYIETIKSFPINTEVRTVKTFSSSAGGGMGAPSPFPSSSLPAASAAGAITLETNTSFIILPEKPMQKRTNDLRVGYFADDYTVYLSLIHI